VNVEHVRELDGHGSETELLVGDADGLRIPVSRERAAAVRATLLSSTMGIRPR
jgi:DNA-binding LytR/AlgR family response regulator